MIDPFADFLGAIERVEAHRRGPNVA